MDRPTNTGRMAAYFWNEGTILPYGLRGVPMNEAALQEPGWTYLLLFYRPDAIPLDDWLAQRGGVLPDRLAFVIPDGTWHQAAHMARRVRPLRDMPCVCLPPGRPGLWKIRTPRLPGQLCTAEAVIRLARWLGSADPADRMEDLLRIIQHHMLIMKGMKDEKEPAPESHTP
jgi:DTW domain-containing protein YfiP